MNYINFSFSDSTKLHSNRLHEYKQLDTNKFKLALQRPVLPRHKKITKQQRGDLQNFRRRCKQSIRNARVNKGGGGIIQLPDGMQGHDNVPLEEQTFPIRGSAYFYSPVLPFERRGHKPQHEDVYLAQGDGKNPRVRHHSIKHSERNARGLAQSQAQ